MNATFIVRISQSRTGRLEGVVERVKTGAKRRFDGSEAIGVAIEEMVRGKAGAGKRRGPDDVSERRRVHRARTTAHLGGSS